MYFKYFGCSLRLFAVVIISSCFIGGASFAAAPAQFNQGSGNIPPSSIGASADQIYASMGDQEKEVIIKLEQKLKSTSNEERSKEINSTFVYAAKAGYQKIMEWMLSNNLRPDQTGINEAFSEAANVGDKNIMEWMLANNLRPDQEGVEDAFSHAAGSAVYEYAGDDMSIMECMLTNNLRPQVSGIFDAYAFAGGGGDADVMQWLIDNNIMPDQDAINEAFSEAAIYDHDYILELMLRNNLIPQDDVIIQSYRNVIADGITDTAQFLERTFPNIITPEIRNEQGRAANAAGQQNFARANNMANNNIVGRAFEIHNFAKEVNNDACRIIVQKLEQAGRQPGNYLSFGDVVTKIKASARTQNINLTSAFEGYINHATDEYMNLMSLVATFVLSFYSDAFDAWVQGFVVDSAQAYQCSAASSAAPTDSCTKGFWERVVTCLDRLSGYGLAKKDPELLNLLGGAQDTMFLRQKIDTFVSLGFLQKALARSGLPKDCSMDQLQEKVKDILSSKFDAGYELAQAMSKLAEYEKYGFWEDLYLDYTGKEYSADPSGEGKK